MLLTNTSINLNNFFLSVSDAIDLSSEALCLHQLRTTYIAWQLAKEAVLPHEACKRVYIASLFHDIGALDPRQKVLLHNFETKDVEPHSILGAVLFSSIWLLAPAAPIVRHHHTPWSYWRARGARLEDEFVLESQLVNLADFVERSINRKQHIFHQTKRIIEQVRSLSGEEFHPEVVDIFENVARCEAFWFDIVNPRIYSLLLKQGPLEKVEIEFDSLVRLTGFFRKIIDFRSPFTATHSAGVAATAVMLSKFLRFTEREITLIEIAANLHDLGKLAVPSEILEKPGRLTPEEFAVIKQHPYYTFVILNSIEGLEQIAEWAACHHEKLDGTGYPFHLSAGDLSLGARILAVADVFTALLEDRPYRKGLSEKEIFSIMEEMGRRNALDPVIVEALFDHYPQISAYVKEKQRRTRHQFDEMIKVPLMGEEGPDEVLARVYAL